jgi:hypothetical protein
MLVSFGFQMSSDTPTEGTLAKGDECASEAVDSAEAFEDVFLASFVRDDGMGHGALMSRYAWTNSAATCGTIALP